MGPHEHKESSSLEMPWQMLWLIAWGKELEGTNQACQHEQNKKLDSTTIQQSTILFHVHG
jgi:hypothetical protein